MAFKVKSTSEESIYTLVPSLTSDPESIVDGFDVGIRGEEEIKHAPKIYQAGAQDIRAATSSCPSSYIDQALMDNLTEGPYQLRYVATEDSIRAIDGLFAARIDGAENPVIVSPRVSSLLDEENWWLNKSPDGTSWHILGEAPLPTLENHGSQLGFSHEEVKDGAPIVTSKRLGKYIMKLLDNGEYAISVAAMSPGISASGVDYVIGVSDKGTLEVHEVRTHSDGQPVVPRWKILRVK
ncbi:peptidase inhibitor clitocypin domain-containing protein [Ceratobasidium sp. AG-Ba]|nr:peptidase inhibitor clitocypin domain-containing protein [Ceratobasidium sp. AG-Ba]